MRLTAAPGFTFLLLTAVCARADVVMVADGTPKAVVVTADEPTPVAQYAAEELVYHVEKATGTKLQIVSENAISPAPAGRIYIGDCQAARKAGIEAESLPAEAFVLRTKGDALFIVGEDGEGDPLSTDTHAGTLWGVYELLEQAMKVRWLWPGELGVHVPKTTTVKVKSFDQTTSPWLFQRNLRHGLSLRYGNERYAFSPAALQKYAHDQQVFLRRHRMGRALRIRYGHAFTKWWEKYGKEHPTWFQLLEDGRRGPATPGSRFSMCVSNPEFHEKIVSLWKEACQKKPGEFININCCENDIRGLCTCERCLSWDGPQPKTIQPRFGPRVVSDRYAQFYLTVQQRAAEEDPKATVVGYAYVNYYPAPVTDIKLNEHVIVGLVPDRFFPREPKEHEWIKKQWDGWRKTGASLFLRPNYFLQGYCMPHIFAHQFADEFQAAARNGMVATDFDSLTGQWATQGPNLYLLVRLHLHPQKPADELLSEYYAAFGPAAKHVKAYFDYWEKYVTKNRKRFDQIAEERAAKWSTYGRMANDLFPPRCFEPAEKRLKDAAMAAAGDPEYAARVAFLQKGLNHARLCARVAAVVSSSDGEVSPAAWGHALQELVTFRRAVENEGIANFNFCASIEARSWKLPLIYNGEDLQPVVEAPEKLEGSPAIPTRGTHTFVVVLKGGEHFRAQVACERIGNYTNPVEWKLFGPDEKRMAEGCLAPEAETEIDMPVPIDGIYVLLARSSRNVARITLLNDHAALAGRQIHLCKDTSPMFFFVPEGVQAFHLTLQSPGPGETAKVRIFDPDDREVAVGSTGRKTTYAAEVAVPPRHAGHAWSLQIEKGDTGTLEDYSLTLGEELPAYWAHAADRLVVPKEQD